MSNQKQDSSLKSIQNDVGFDDPVRRENTQLHAIVDNISGLVSYVDRDMNYRYVNAGYEKLYNMPKSAFIGKKVEDILTPSIWENARPHFEAALDGEQVTYEGRFNSPAMGTHAQVNLKPDIAENGLVRGVFILVTDISDLKLAQQELSETNAKLKRSEENMSQMMESSLKTELVVSQAGEIIFCNSRIRHMFGYTIDEVVGSRVDILIPEALRPGHGHYMDQYLKDPHVRRLSFSQDLLGQKKNGELIPVDIGLSPIKYDGNSAVLVSIQDIAEIRTAFDASEQLAAIVEASPDAIFRTAIGGEITFWSKGAEKLYGYKAEEVVGRTADIIIPERNPGVRENFNSTLLQGKSIYLPNEYRVHKDGTIINVIVSVSPLRNNKGVIIGGASVHHDIRELKALEEQLLHSQRMETAGQMAGGIAHDFNNILTVMQGYCGLIAESLPPDSTLAGQISAIERATQRASVLTRKLLTFSRRQPTEPRVLNLNRTLEDILVMLSRTLPENIRIETDFSAQWDIKEDPTQIEQIVLNLSLNAQHAMAGGGTLRITTHDELISQRNRRRPESRDILMMPLPVSPGHYVVMTVSDTGTGMDKGQMEHIFEPFYTTKDKEDGTGLGLAVVYGMISQAGGGIHVRSSKGKGSVFEIYLPRSEGVANEETQSPQTMSSAGQEKILLVEDDKEVLDLTRAILQTAGYEVVSTSTPLEFLEGDFNEPVDLVLSDIVMPGMTGHEFARHWERRHPNSRFLFMSGYIDENRTDFPLIARNLLLKPFRPNDLISRVRQALEDPASGAENLHT